MDYRAYFKDKRVTLMGLGLLGRGVGDARFLAECGAELVVTDLKSESELEVSLAQLRAFPNILFHLGGHHVEDFAGRDLILKAAGVPLDSVYIAEARKNGIRVRMSADLFAELSGIPIVGITGTRGKSTVTHMVAHILRRAGLELLLGGNIKGVSTLSLLPSVKSDSIAVLELDSWQLQGFGDAALSPHISIFTTFMPDHMNYYKQDLRAYFADKANIFLNQNESDTLVVGEGVVPYLKDFGYQKKIKARVAVVGADNLPKNIALLIPGEHNRLNAALARAAAEALGVDDETSKAALETFIGVPGRLQLVQELHGVRIYNDTTSTVPEAALAALRAVGDEKKKNIVLIMGGSDKGLDMTSLLAETKKYCKRVLLLDGTGTQRVREDLPGATIYHTMAEAVNDAFTVCEKGDVLLMSPAFASFGMFQNEYDRGDQFDAAVKGLI